MLGDLKQLRAFLMIARLGNFTRAAYALNISQSALSIQIKQLETQLSMPLFDRNRRRVSLTPQGLELLPRVERAIAEIEGLLAYAQDASDSKRGVVTVATLPSLAADILPRAIRLLQHRHSHIIIRIHDTVATRVTELARNGEVDFGIGSQFRDDPELAWESLLVDHFCAFIAADYPWPPGDTSTLADIVRHPLLLPVRESSIRMHLEAAADKQKILLPATYEAVYNSTLLAIASEGLGVAILSELIGRGANTKNLRRIAIKDPPIYRSVGILKRSGRSLSPAAELFIDALRQVTRTP